MLAHIREKSHKCTRCEKSFTNTSSLRSHMITHTGELPVKCELCPFVCQNKVLLKRHVCQIHTGEKPYKCTICKQSFAMQSNVKMHMYIHTEDKPHKCKECEKAFTKVKSLKITSFTINRILHTSATTVNFLFIG